MKTILLPIDFSQSSIYALDIAFQVALASDSNIQLLNVIEKVPNNSNRSEETIAADHKVLKEEHERELENFMKHYETIRDLDPFRHLCVSFEIIIGEIVNGIIAYSNDIEAHLIVIGSHGKQESYDKAMGSIAQSLIGTCKTPLLTVPFGLQKTQNLGGQSFAYAIDYLSKDYDQLFFMLGLTEMFDGHLHILNVSKNDLTLNEGTEKWFRRTQSKMIDFDRITFNLLSDEKDIQQSIISFCKEKEIQLLGITTKHELDPLSTKSISRPLTKMLNIPLLYFSK